MAVTVRVEARTIGRRRPRLESRPLELPADAGSVITLRQVIELVVVEQVDAFKERAEGDSMIRFLTEREIDEALADGGVSFGDREAAIDIDVDDAVATALLAFEDGLVKVMVDGVDRADLDDEVALQPGTRLLFVRLVGLAGG